MEAQGNKPTVLIVEDERGPRDALKVILRPFFNVHVAENAKSALQMLREHSIDLVTLDQKLPDVQGLDLLQDIRVQHENVEVIIITGYGSLKSAMEGIRYGAAGYLLKPFNVTELINLINQTLEKKQRLDSLRELLKDSVAHWDSEQETEQTWKHLTEEYFVLSKPKPDPETLFGKYSELLPLLSDLLEAKDRHLFNHASRVSFYSTLFANHLNLASAEQKSLSLGAFLHDIGNITYDHHIIAHPDQLSHEECESLKRHPEIGARMILPLGFPAEVGQIISYHHERHDGTGYPYGLQGEGIPRLARVVAIAQSFDHLTIERPGRQALSVDDAIKHIARQAGTAFDPALVEVFTKVMSQCKASLPALTPSSHPTTMPDL